MSREPLLDAIAEPLLVLDGNRVDFANRAAREMFGEHAVGQDVRLTVRHPEAAALFASGADGAVEIAGPAGRDQRLEIRVAHAVNGRRIVQVNDRSARHIADRTRTDFVANASHELRTPLSAILGFVETLRDDTAGADPKLRQRFLKVMDEEARRMGRLIEELISLSRIEADKFILPEGSLKMRELVEAVAEEAQRPGDIVLELKLEDVPSVRGDRPQLSQLLHNLIDNARRYGGEGVIVTVSLSRDGADACLQVTDNGPGISAGHLPRLTERFYRADPARSRASGGTGLGLAIVKHIVERHRGRLEITSAPGSGTRVSVALPFARKPRVTEASRN